MERHRQFEIGSPVPKIGPRLGIGFNRADQFVDGHRHGTCPNDRTGERSPQKLSKRTTVVLCEQLGEERITNSNSASIASDIEFARRGVVDSIVEEDLDVVGEADHATSSRIEEPITVIEMAEDPARFRSEEEPQEIKE